MVPLHEDSGGAPTPRTRQEVDPKSAGAHVAWSEDTDVVAPNRVAHPMRPSPGPETCGGGFLGLGQLRELRSAVDPSLRVLR